MFAKIEPVTIFPSQASQLRCIDVLVINIGPAGQSTVTWGLFNDLGSILTSGSIGMNNSDYSLWGDDDSYILTWLAGKLGLTILEISSSLPESILAIQDSSQP